MIKKMIFLCNGHDATLVRWALKYLCDAVNAEGIPTTIVDYAKMNNENFVGDADVIMVYRSFDLRILNLMKRLRQQGRFVMFFLDDYLFQMNCKYTGDWNTSMGTLNEADCLVSSNAVLLSNMPPQKPKILRRSVLDEEALGVLKQEYRRDSDKFVIGLLSGSGRRKLMEQFICEMLYLLDGMIPSDKQCIFAYFGHREYPRCKNIVFKENLYFTPESWKPLYEKWVSLDMGVVINPLEEDDQWCHCKSELKFVESAAMGVPIITSRVFPYNGFLTEGKTGFFASTPEEFAKKILLVMMNEPLSRKVSTACNAYMLENYNVKDNAKQFLKDIEDAMQKNMQWRLYNHFGWPRIPRKPF